MVKLIAGVCSLVVVGGIVAYLFVTTAGRAMEFYKHVDEVAEQQGNWLHRPLELHGYVKPDSIQKRLDRDHQRLEYKFVETNCGKEIPVFYAGTVPDTFKESAEVVVKGQLEGDGFHATEVMAKCPSKYQATVAPKTMCTRDRMN
jgi:cytochrome c-type biogenesis protein CcmE